MTLGTILSVQGHKSSSDEVIITTTTHIITMSHGNVCCSSGYIEECTGEESDVLGAELISIDMLSQSDYTPYHQGESSFHFYEVKTTKGDLWSRWYSDTGQTGMYSDEIRVEIGERK